MLGMKKITGIGRKIWKKIWRIFGLKKKTRGHKSTEEFEKQIQEIDEELMELDDMFLDRMIEEMTAVLNMVELGDVVINEDDLKIDRINDRMFYYGYVHGGPYGAVDCSTREEKIWRFNMMMRIMMEDANTPKIGP